MKPDVIYLDMDGVLVDFVAGVMREFDVPIKNREKVRGWDEIPKVLSEVIGREITDAEMWLWVQHPGEYFWADLDWLPWGGDLYRMCCEIAPVVLMSTPSKDPASAAGKLMWIDYHMSDAQSRRYSLSPCKHLMAHPGALLIDDSGRNVAKFREAGGSAVLVPAPWNEFGRWPTTKDVLSQVRKAFDE